MELIPFIHQKVTAPPAGSAIVPRSRLYNMLSQGQQKLVAVVAPAGYGKSVLLGNWVLRSNAQACWYSLDAADNHRVSFLHYLIESVRVQFPSFGKSLIKQLHTSQPQIEQILVQFIRELSELKNKIHLILDDFHFITNPDIHRILHYLTIYLPQNTRLIVSSRTPLPIPLTKMKLHSELLEITAEELAFNWAEAAHLLQNYHLPTDDKQTRDIVRKTEGWAAGIQLISLAHQQARFLTHNSTKILKQDVHNYLFEEVFQGLPADTQEFLLDTSILSQLEESLCNHVTKRSDSRLLFEQLVEDNLFLISLDDQRRLYRYHHLFSDFLQNRLMHTHPENIDGLHHRAAEWYQSKQFYTEALNHELLANNSSEACTLLTKLAPAMLKQGNAEEFLNIIGKIPPDAVQSSPFLVIYYCWALFLGSRTDEAVRHISSLENQIDTGAFSQEDSHALLLEIWHFHGHISFLRKNFDDILKYRLKISDYLPYESEILKTIDFNPNHMYLSRGFLGSYGDFACSSAFFTKIDEYMKRGFPLENPILGLLTGYLGELAFEKNQLDRAETHLSQAMQIGQKEKLAGIYIPSFTAFLRLKKLQHPAYPTESAIKDLKQFVTDCDMPQWHLSLDAFQVRMDMRDEKESDLKDWIARTKLLTE
ncbi:hypothetical protein GI364_23805 [Alicyclobacillus sp. SO9]|nr:hypothetical protein GI364_23805 [Alicyclobacillus sp. SO9]